MKGQPKCYRDQKAPQVSIIDFATRLNFFIGNLKRQVGWFAISGFEARSLSLLHRRLSELKEGQPSFGGKAETVPE
jgi:hypothetical protein